jgi:hypothetical protein
MELKSQVEKYERLAGLRNRQLMIVVDQAEGKPFYTLGSAAREYELLSEEELRALREKHGEDLLFVSLLQ